MKLQEVPAFLDFRIRDPHYFVIQFQPSISWKLAKTGNFGNFLDPIRGFILKRVPQFVIPEFHDTLLVPKITKCGDLLYNCLPIKMCMFSISLIKNDFGIPKLQNPQANRYVFFISRRETHLVFWHLVFSRCSSPMVARNSTVGFSRIMCQIQIQRKQTCKILFHKLLLY